MATATEGEEYKILKQKSPLVKAANVFALIWIAAITCPALYFVYSHADELRRFAVVAAVGKTNGIVTEQFSAFTGRVLKEVKVEKYISKIKIDELDAEKLIKIPEIKLDKLDKVKETTQKTKKVTSALSKLGVKQADKIDQTTEELQKQANKLKESAEEVKKQIDKVNQKMKTTVDQVKKTLDSEVQAGLKKEIDTLAGSQIKKQLALSDGAYNSLKAEKYGFMSDAERAVTSRIYTELAQNKKGVFSDVIRAMEEYYKWILAGVMLLVLVITLVPVLLVKKIAKKLSATFTQCPHCGKVFVTKANALSILKMLKP